MLSSGSSRSIGGNFGTLARPPGLWTRIRKKLRSESPAVVVGIAVFGGGGCGDGGGGSDVIVWSQ